jgi:hypothetical protein
LFAGQGAQGVQGNQGLQGTSGAVGGQGTQGAQGRQGTQGLIGAQGIDGQFGQTGSQGTQGTQGRQGSQGTFGAVGSQGSQGIIGIQGTQGVQSAQGSQGLNGLFAGQGTQGLQGTQGRQGLQGLEGALGQDGFQGTQGLQGRQGAQGTQGLSVQGVQGTLAAQGRQGTQGLAGFGFQGTQGTNGSQGLVGANGISGGPGSQGTQGTVGPVGGTNTQLIYNNNGQAGGATGLTWDGTALSYSVLSNRYAGTNSNLNAASFAYSILQESGTWSGTFPDLVINNHTGISFGANPAYEGYRFWNDYTRTSVVLQINNPSSKTQTYQEFVVTDSGITAATNGFAVRPNTSTNFGAAAVSGSRNGYGGIYDASSGVADMWDSGGSGGWYRDANGRWYSYWNNTNLCLAVAGSTTSAAYSLYINGDAYSSGTITAASDARKKENIQTIENALEKVQQLRGVSFVRNDLNETDPNYKKQQIGVIAQEIEKVLPEVVTYASDVDEYAVSYGNISAVLIEAIKELKVELEEIKTKINS